MENLIYNELQKKKKKNLHIIKKLCSHSFLTIHNICPDQDSNNPLHDIYTSYPVVENYLPVVGSKEDDCGISRWYVYASVSNRPPIL